MPYIKSCAVVMILLLCVTACNTVEGIGRDLKKAGNSIEGAAAKNK